MTMYVGTHEDDSAAVPLRLWCCYVTKCCRKPIKKVTWHGSVITLCRPHLKEFELDPSVIIDWVAETQRDIEALSTQPD